MGLKFAKVAVSLPKQTFDRVEHVRHELGLARSTAISEALNLWLRQKEEEELEAKYVNGYKKKPENASASKPLFHAGLSSFTEEEW